MYAIEALILEHLHLTYFNKSKDLRMANCPNSIARNEKFR